MANTIYDDLEETARGHRLSIFGQRLVEHSLIHWQRIQELDTLIKQLETEKVGLLQSRQQLVTAMSSIATLVGVAYPAPDKIIATIQQLQGAARAGI